MLARRSGASDLPLDSSSAVPFASPPSLRVSLPVPNAKQLVGMGVRRGVTLIVGGGFHGKSTLLEALQLGVYDKVPGDGREGVVTDGAAVKVHACMLACREGGGRGSYRCARIAADVAIDCCPHQVRAEDGRAVTAVDISPFIDHLPFGKRTTAFATEDASGSTSQAAAIIEALETGASALLMDEDTSATNFLMRDARMQALVAADKEPIKPFITRVSSEHLGLRWIGR
jgi:predicted ABC-class ATPase